MVVIPGGVVPLQDRSVHYLFHNGKNEIAGCGERPAAIPAREQVDDIPLKEYSVMRAGILPIGGNKAGRKRFYAEMIALADRLYDDHIAELKREGLIK